MEGEYNNERGSRWVRLVRNTLIGVACFAGVAGGLKVADHVYHDIHPEKEEQHLEKLEPLSPHSYTVLKSPIDSNTVYLIKSKDVATNGDTLFILKKAVNK